MFSIFTSHSFAAKKHKIYKKLPCNFNGVKVSTSAQFHDGVKGGRCCPKCSGYKSKRGTSIIMKRGTPIVAIADMKLISIYDISAHQKSKKKSESVGKKDGTDHSQSQKTMKPYDDIHLHFVDKKGNFILYYHFKETNLVKGFNQGNCKIPKEFQWGRKKFLPQDCGGYSEELIRNNFWVKKGQVIGLSGATGTSKGGPHISLGIAIPANEKIKKGVIKKSPLFDIILYFTVDFISLASLFALKLSHLVCLALRYKHHLVSLKHSKLQMSYQHLVYHQILRLLNDLKYHRP